MVRVTLLAACLVAALAACGEARFAARGAGDADAGQVVDAEAGGGDAGAADGAADGAAGDAASADLPAGPLPLAVACEDASDDVYVTPGGLTPWGPSALGDVVRCADAGAWTVAQAGDRLATLGVDVAATAGVRRLRLAYRTERDPGVEGVGTAMVYLPDPAPAGALPRVVVAHGTAGLADRCAPSRVVGVGDTLALTFAATGIPVISPDYAGLGNEGVQGYGASRDTAHSVLDAARALGRLLGAARLDGRVVVTGHSQGGGAALFAQALARERLGGGDDEVVAVIPFAPGWRAEAQVATAPYRFPQLVPTALGAGVAAAVTVLRLYADLANHGGGDQVGSFYHPDARDALVALIEGECIYEIAAAMPSFGPTFADLLDPAFGPGVADCLDGLACVEPYAGFAARLQEGYLPLDAAGAPVLYVQGAQDAQATADRAACYVDAMGTMGVAPQLCVDPDATHFDVVARNAALARAWVAALLEGREPPRCAVEALPDCDG